jgi:hypothetical protein
MGRANADMGCPCPCHTQEIFTWQDDHDFTAQRHLTGGNFPALDTRVLTDQPVGTELLWRIKCLGNQNNSPTFKALYSNGSVVGDIGIVISMGPVRGGQMMGSAGCQSMYPAPTSPTTNGAFFTWDAFSPTTEWYFSGEDTSGNNPGNDYALEIGCVKCNCHCLGEPTVRWPGGFSAVVSDRERDAVYWLGDSYDTDATGCAPNVGYVVEGTSAIHDWRDRLYSKTKTFSTLSSGAVNAVDGIRGITPDGSDMTPLDIIFHEYAPPGGSGDEAEWQYSILSNNPEHNQAWQDICAAYKSWLDQGNKTLVLSLYGWITGASPYCNYTKHGPILDAETAFGINIWPACQDWNQTTPSTTATTVGSHVLLTGVSSCSHKSVHGGLPTSGSTTTLFECSMPFTSGAATVPVVVMHDMGGGSRLILSLANWTDAKFYQASPNANQGFLSAVNDVFITNVINQHGNY